MWTAWAMMAMAGNRSVDDPPANVTVEEAAHSIPATAPADPVDTRPLIEIVIALDTSGSMSAMLDSARRQLWDVVNLIAEARPQPRLRVGLYTYGRSDDADQGYLRQEIALTDDLDLVSGRLMSNVSPGGSEFVGQVVDAATIGAGWSDEPRTVRLLFVCGNETAEQGPVRFADATGRAQEREITVNAVYGGKYDAGIAEKWQQLAVTGRGIYAAIDMVAGTIRLPPAPQDALIEELNAELSETYVSIRGLEQNKANQLSSDASSSALGTTGTRALAKTSELYVNRWDLVDAWRSGQLDLSKPEILPSHLQAKSLSERQAYVEGLSAWRKRVQAKIRAAVAERDAWLATERAKQLGAPSSLGDALQSAVRTQLEGRGFTF